MPVGHEDAEPPRALMRKIVAVRGSMELRSEVCPRFDYGCRSVVPTQEREGGEVTFDGGDVRLRLRATVALRTHGDAAVATFALHEGDTVAFSLDLEPDTSAGEALDVDAVRETFDATRAFWRGWLEEGPIGGGGTR
jgi:hypothetical protein